MAETLRYHDISPPLTNRLAVFPGDVPFRRDISMDFNKGDHLGLSSIYTTLHAGAHVDAPNHYNVGGAGIGERDLSYYLGPCQVVEIAAARGERITVKMIEDVKITAPRILFKTKSYPDPNTWNGDFNSLSRELIGHLAEKNVILVGIDTPSIDPAEDKILESHNAVFTHNMAVLEGIVLDRIAPGNYFLIALPLRIPGGDASPVRAVLVDNQGGAL